MLIYLLSLPIWNAILPAYSFWHFDDFSWGATRQIEGEKEGESHGDKEGEFDPSHIIMKRWNEFERDRRYKTGTNSRDSTDDFTRSPRRNDYRRSVVSNIDSGSTLDILRVPASPSRASLSGPPLIELPHPLSNEASNTSSTPLPVPKIPSSFINDELNKSDINGNIGLEQPFIRFSHENSPKRNESDSEKLSSIPSNNPYQQSQLEDNHLNSKPPFLDINLVDQGPVGESPRRLIKPTNRRNSPSSSVALEQLNHHSQQRRTERDEYDSQ